MMLWTGAPGDRRKVDGVATVPLSAPKITRRETMIDSLVVSYAALS
jgi:hypothetical protein